jgi:hypothetical protein
VVGKLVLEFFYLKNIFLTYFDSKTPNKHPWHLNKPILQLQMPLNLSKKSQNQTEKYSLDFDLFFQAS